MASSVYRTEFPAIKRRRMRAGIASSLEQMIRDADFSPSGLHSAPMPKMMKPLQRAIPIAKGA